MCVCAAENLGFTSYPQAYLDKKAKGRNLLIGANFASAASGYYDGTAKLYVSIIFTSILCIINTSVSVLFFSELVVFFVMKSAISLPQQLEHYKDYISRIQEIATSSNANATSIISDGIYVVSAGSSDFIQNYYINPLLYKVQSPDDFSDLLILSYSNFIQVIPTPPLLLSFFFEYQKARNISNHAFLVILEFIFFRSKKDRSDYTSTIGMFTSGHNSGWSTRGWMLRES